MALPGVIAPGAIDMAIVDRDYPLMLMLTAGFYLVAFGPRRGPGNPPLRGAGCCCRYTLPIWLIYSSTPALSVF